MGWYNSGNWAGLTVEALSHIVAELCYAVNEREAIAGITLTQWAKASGTGTYPVASDFAGLTIEALYSRYAAIKTAVASLLTAGFYGPSFIKTTTPKEVATLAFVLGQGNYGSSWLFSASPIARTGSIWIQIKEALEHIIHIRYWLQVLAVARWRTYSSWADLYDDADPLWSADYNYPWSDPEIILQVTNLDNPPQYHTHSYYLSLAVTNPQVSGTIVRGYLAYNASVETPPSPMEISLDGHLLSTSGAQSTNPDDWIDMGDAWPNLGADTPITFQETLPALEPGLNLCLYTVACSPGFGSNVVVDFSSLLTYG